MPPALLAVLATLLSLFRSRASLQAEVLSLRHQLLVLDRQRAGMRVPLRTSDRVLWSWLSCIWPGWRQALVIVQPETVIRWHRQGFRLYRRRKSRSQRTGCLDHVIVLNELDEETDGVFENDNSVGRGFRKGQGPPRASAISTRLNSSPRCRRRRSQRPGGKR